MAQEFDDYEEEFTQSGGGWWIQKIGIIVYMLVIVAYAIQTLQLVNWLFPADNWFMKIVTVFVCDGCATGYAMAEMFYRYRLRRSKHLTFGMWIVTFVLSTAATVIQMYLSSTHNIPHDIDPSIVTLAYGLIILAFVVNILAITIIIRMEYGASQPAHRYLDDNKPRKRKPAPTQLSDKTNVPMVTQASSNGHNADVVTGQLIPPSPSQIPDMALRAVEEAYLAGLRKGQSEQQSPLQQPVLGTQQQAGQNGNGHNGQ